MPPPLELGPRLTELTDPGWVRYANRHPRATVFHHPQWANLIARCYGFRSFALVLTDASGAVIGGTPVIEVRRPMQWRPTWSVLPFTDHCPILADDAEAERVVAAALRDESAAAGVLRVVIRGPVDSVPGTQVAVRHVVPLATDIETVARDFRGASVRQSVRKATRAGVRVRVATRAEDLTVSFFRLQLLTRRRHGVPAQPRRFFRMLWEEIIETGFGTLLLAEHDGEPIAGKVTLESNTTVIDKYSASDHRAWSLHPNHLLYGESIRLACEAGHSWYDLGRTDLDNEGLRHFKRSWGADEQPLLHTEFGTSRVPRSSTGRFATLSTAALRAAPLWVCRASGEALYRYAA